MKAALLREPGDLVVADVPQPPMRPNEVLVKVSDCGICGSDVRYYHGDNPWSKETLGVYVQPPPNIILGHEVAGVVVNAGPEASKDIIGKRVGILSFDVDGTCYWCRRGMRHLCPNTVHLGHSAGWGKQDYYYGGMAEYVAVWSDHCYELPESVSNESAALLDPLCVAIHGVRKSGMQAGDTVLARGGRLVTYAVQEREEPFSTMSMSGERSISSTANFGFPDFQTGLDMLASGAVNAEAIITHRFPLSQAPDAFAAADRKGETGAIKVLLKIPD